MSTEVTGERGSIARCDVCPHACVLAPGKTGICRARRNVDGRVTADNYGRITSAAVDPIEKKPLAAFMPGSTVLSVGSYGCNLRCPFCQNAGISQVGEDDVPWRDVPAEALVDEARRLHERDARMVGIAYTYNEPLVGWEYVHDCADLAHRAGLKNVLVSNGYASEHVIRALAPLIDAANIDLKAFNDAFYHTCGGDLRTVQRTIEVLARTPTCHVELTTLIVPGMNDSTEEMDAEARWIAALDPRITLHVTRFFPCWKLQDRGPTPVSTVHHLADVARAHLPHVLVGNC